MTVVKILEAASDFAENKDTARDLRVNVLMPSLASGDSVEVDFTGVHGATQSFVHALISEAIRQYGSEVLDRLSFKGCEPSVRGIVEIVVGYMQEGLEE